MAALCDLGLVSSLEEPVDVVICPRIPHSQCNQQRRRIVRPVSRNASLENGFSVSCLLLSTIHVSQGQNRELFGTRPCRRTNASTGMLLGTVVDENEAVVPEQAYRKGYQQNNKKGDEDQHLGVFIITELPARQLHSLPSSSRIATAESKSRTQG